MTTGSSVTIKGLDKDVKYQFFVISRNQFGTSLPSSLIRVNVSDSAWNGKKVEGKPSAPHGIELVKAGAKMLSFAWTAPVISNHDDLIKYRKVQLQTSDSKLGVLCANVTHLINFGLK